MNSLFMSANCEHCMLFKSLGSRRFQTFCMGTGCKLGYACGDCIRFCKLEMSDLQNVLLEVWSSVFTLSFVPFLREQDCVTTVPFPSLNNISFMSIFSLQNSLININIFQNLLIDINIFMNDIFKNCHY